MSHEHVEEHNSSSNPTFDSILEQRLSRRALLPAPEAGPPTPCTVLRQRPPGGAFPGGFAFGHSGIDVA